MNTQTQKSNKVINYYPIRDTINFPIYSYIANNITMWNTERKLKKELLNPSVIFIYQMGKVGSFNLYSAIKKAFPEQAIYHLHNLNPEIVAKIWEQIKFNKPYYAFTFGHLFTTKYLSDHIEEIKSQKKIKIITGVREPIGRNISWFFQIIHCECVFPDFFRRFKKGLITMEDINNSFWAQDFVFGKQFDWFELELQSVFGIDINSIDFPKEKGYTIVNIPEKNIELLVLKLDKMDDCLKEVIPSFLGVANLDYERIDFLTNEEHQIYNNFRNSLKFSNEYLEQIYEQKLVKHFYTDEEINKFKQKWSSQN